MEKKIVLAHLLQCVENKLNALPEFFEQDNRLMCPECKNLTDPFYRTPNLAYRGKQDLSATYEGKIVVSKDFLTWCQLNHYDNLLFFPINNKCTHFYLSVEGNKIAVDTKASGITCEKPCSTCLHARNVFGDVRRLVLAIDSPLEDGFYQTDFRFRNHYSFKQTVLIGPSTSEKLLTSGLKGYYPKICYY